MEMLVFFTPSNEHPFAWLLNEQHRHVWCAAQDLERGVWVSYDWKRGLPRIRVEAPYDYDLADHYARQGQDVVRIQRGSNEGVGPFMLNNCVSHTKMICGIRSFALTPRQLYRHLTEGSFTMRLLKTLRSMTFLPGFGGGPSAPPPPPPPPPPPEPPKKSDPAVQQARSDEKKRAQLQAGAAGTIKTSSVGVTTPADTTTKTLLGN